MPTSLGTNPRGKWAESTLARRASSLYIDRGPSLEELSITKVHAVVWGRPVRARLSHTIKAPGRQGTRIPLWLTPSRAPEETIKFRVVFVNEIASWIIPRKPLPHPCPNLYYPLWPLAIVCSCGRYKHLCSSSAAPTTRKKDWTPVPVRFRT